MLAACGHGAHAAPKTSDAAAQTARPGCGCGERKGGEHTTCSCKKGHHKHGRASTPDLTPVPFKVWESLGELEVRSRDFENRTTLPLAHVFNGFGCQGDNAPPALEWSAGPEGTESYAVVAFDPDAPTGVGFFHLLAYNIGNDVTQLEGGTLPEGAGFGRNDYGAAGYGGPCPPEGHGTHRYVFSVYALNTQTLELGEQPSGALLRFMIKQHAIAAGHLVGYYGR